MRNWKLHNVSEIQSNDNLLKEFYLDYNELFEKPCISCKNKLNLYYKLLVNYKKMADKTCELRPGNHYFHSKGMHYNNHNITDEIANEMIKDNPNRKKIFVKLPSGAKKAADVEVKDQKAADDKLPIEKKSVKKKVVKKDNGE